MSAARARNLQIEYQVRKSKFLLWMGHTSLIIKLLTVAAVLAGVVIAVTIFYSA
jgi:hypothetical protein